MACYGAAAWAAALFMIGTLAMILLSVSGRLLDFHVRGTDAYAGYCMAAAAFLAWRTPSSAASTSASP
jgi:TRAP-type C4-dicarboxylate transport system permease small subunit